MNITYQSGSYCCDVNCPEFSTMDCLSEQKRISRKRDVCRDCCAWSFYLWLKKNGYVIFNPYGLTGHCSANTGLKGSFDSPFHNFNEKELMLFHVKASKVFNAIENLNDREMRAILKFIGLS